jgi:acetyl esterase/lipase
MRQNVKLACAVAVLMGLLAQPALTADSPSADTRSPLPEGARTQFNIPYTEHGGPSRTLDLYLPAKGTNLPLIVWIHGGAWMEGNKENPPGLGFLKHGFALASINYRLSQEAAFPAQLVDCKASIRWLRAHAAENGIDPDHIGVWGASAGGHLVALLGTTGDVKEFDQGDNLSVSSRVQAVCDWFGPTDLAQLAKYSKDYNPTAPDSAVARLIGGTPSQNAEKVERANPIHYLAKDDPPFLIMHGDKDPLVPLEQSQILADALKNAGVPVKFYTIEGAGHGGPEFRALKQRERVFYFFKETLSPD